MSDMKNSLTALAERGQPIGSDHLRERVVMDLLEQSALSRKWQVSPAWAAIAAAGAVLLLIGGIPLLFGNLGDGEPTAEQPPASMIPATTVPPTPTTQAAPVSTTATPTTAPIVVPPPETTWERIVDEAFAPGMIWAVASTDDVIVAIGEMPDPLDVSTLQDEAPDGVVWVSADGRSWDRIDDESVFGGSGAQILHEIISGPLGFIASGQDGADAVLWFSPDGYDWAKVLVDDLGTPGAVDGLVVVADGPGWVAIYDDDDPGEVVFVSPDGFEWTRIDDQVAAREYVGVVEASDGSAPITVPPLLGVSWDFAWDGERVIGVCRGVVVSIWLSEDSGATWHRVDPEQEVFEGGWPPPQSLGVTLFGSEIVVGGNAGNNTAIWQDDAAIWIGQWKELSQ
jgi:hypothetical protein